MFKVIVGSFCALVSRWPVTPKWLAVAKPSKILDLGVAVVYVEYLCRDEHYRLSDCPGQLKVTVGQLNFPLHLNDRTSKI